MPNAEPPPLTPAALRKMANERRKDARVLFSKKRFEGAVYLCGYVVELALKARICRTLKWQSFPQKAKQFEDLRSFKTHNLEILLRLSGREASVKEKAFAEWSTVNTWDPEMRYSAGPSVYLRADTSNTLLAVDTILKLI